ncbi:hypothetical protein [Flavobacterium pedocola]
MLSEKQQLFAEYLLKKIGYLDSNLIRIYLVKLELIYGKFYKEWRQEKYPSGYLRDYWVLKYSNSECIEELLKEIEIKKNLGSIILKSISEKKSISATDISSFNFCPVSYSISKSFEIEHPTNEDKRLTGINLHESLRLIDKKLPPNCSESSFFDSDVLNNEKIKKIKNCEVVFSGHSNENFYFVNQEKNYIGQPDYIFRDTNNKYFVVEEKFKFLNNYIDEQNFDYEKIIKKREKIKNHFFENHILQLQSYIENIKEYNIEYGILIYWFYDFEYELPNVHSVSLKIIRKGENSEILNKTVDELKNFITTKSIDLTNNVNPNKCAACSVNKYCAHKTNELKNLSFPYNRYFMKLKYVDFPDELKKD